MRLEGLGHYAGSGSRGLESPIFRALARYFVTHQVGPQRMVFLRLPVLTCSVHVGCAGKGQPVHVADEVPLLVKLGNDMIQGYWF